MSEAVYICLALTDAGLMLLLAVYYVSFYFDIIVIL